MLARLTKKFPLEIFALIAFLAILPLSWKINYLQNDEFTHFQSVLNFLHGNFTLHPYIITTFYSQGALEGVWVYLFGISHIAILTLIVSVLAVYFFTKIIKENFNISLLSTLLLGVLFLVNPIFLYSSLGNMTENYFIFYFMISLYFFYSYLREGSNRSFILSIIFATLGFLTRQVGILITLGYGLYFLFQRRYKQALINLTSFVLTTTWYYTIFPKTPQMIRSSGASFDNISDPKHAFSLIIILLSYVGVFFLPLVISLISTLKSYSKKHLMIFFGLLTLFTFLFIKDFRPGSLVHTSVLQDGRELVQNNSTEFPYLWNTYGRTGFFPDNIAGTRYHYAGYFMLFKIYHYVGIICAIFLLSYLLFILFTKKRTNLFKPALILFVVNIGITFVLSKVYDRYLLPSFPLFILAALELKGVDFGKLEKLVLACFIALFVFLGYQYSMDFVLVNRFAWDKATNLVAQGVEPKMIKIGNAWGVMNPNPEREYSYHVSYQTKRGFEVLEKYKIEFPFSIYIEPYVYLVKQLPEEN